MQEFLRLVQEKAVKVEPLITQEFPVINVADAYDALVKCPSTSLAILLRYDDAAHSMCRAVALPSQRARLSRARSDATNIAVVGCGAFARQAHLPNLAKMPRVHLRAIVSSTGHSAREMASRYHADYCTTDFQEVLRDDQVDAVMIMSRDKTHAAMTCAALRADKHVFCEKPIATSLEECRAVEEASSSTNALCMVGFNRRFAPLLHEVKGVVAKRNGPCVMQYRVNAGRIAKEHWTADPTQSAGRIIGEACHFVDLFHWLLEQEPVDVFAIALGRNRTLHQIEDISANFRFSDGSIATLLYTASGSNAFSKERIEIFVDGNVVMVDDFAQLTMRGKKRVDRRDRRPDKGHANELLHFVQTIQGHEPLNVSERDGIRATVCCLKILESIQLGTAVPMDWGSHE
jgi:predicted dehydrogenase